MSGFSSGQKVPPAEDHTELKWIPSWICSLFPRVFQCSDPSPPLLPVTVIIHCSKETQGGKGLFHLILPGNNSSLGDVRAETIGSHVRNASYWLIPWPAQLVSLYSPRYPAGGQYFAHQSSIKRILQSLGYRPL